jgi:hypothetical protein
MKTLFCHATRKTSKLPEKDDRRIKMTICAGLRHTLEISLAERREIENQQALRSCDADFSCDGRLASAGERRGSNADLIGA